MNLPSQRSSMYHLMRPLVVEENSQISHEVRSVNNSVMRIVCYLHFFNSEFRAPAVCDRLTLLRLSGSWY